MKKQIRLVAFQNDAMALAAANFYFPIYAWRTVSERTTSLTNMVQKIAWIVRTKNISQILGLNPKKNNPHYLTLTERLQNLPKGFSPKIDKAICVFQIAETLYVLKWVKDTIHKSFTPELDYQNWILKQIKNAWQTLKLSYSKIKDAPPLEEFRPSILVLESVHPADNPAIELANDEKFLFETLLPTLMNENNPISQKMYDVAYRTQVKRGVWEYKPREA